MWRSLFLAVGISLCIFGGECLVIERAVLALPPEKVENNSIYSQPAAPRRKVVQPPEWAPWSLLSAGAIVALYSLTLARNNG